MNKNYDKISKNLHKNLQSTETTSFEFSRSDFNNVSTTETCRWTHWMMIWIKLIVVFLTAVIGWLLAALQFKSEWKDGRTTISKRGRKILFVVLPIVLLVSLVLTYLDHRNTQALQQGDQKFKGTVESYVTDQKKSDVPELVVLDVKGSKSGYTLRVKNIGEQPATKVKVIFTDDSTPNAFAANLIAGTREIPDDTEYTFPLNLFSGINLLMKLPNSEEGYKEALQESLEKFNSGMMAFIPRFHLEYYFGDRKITSSQYFLVVEKKGIVYFGKEE